MRLSQPPPPLRSTININLRKNNSGGPYPILSYRSLWGTTPTASLIHSRVYHFRIVAHVVTENPRRGTLRVGGRRSFANWH